MCDLWGKASPDAVLSADDAGSPGSLRDMGGGICASGRVPTYPVCASGQSAAKGGEGQSAAKDGARQSAAKGGAGQSAAKGELGRVLPRGELGSLCLSQV